MREIKFRAWSSSWKEWREDWYMLSSGKVCSFSGAPIDVILCQYTGLKDKNGKEIYEGDIVEEPWDELPLEVYYLESDTGFRLKNTKRDHRLSGLYGPEAYTLKIIGNIYENPELLEKP